MPVDFRKLNSVSLQEGPRPENGKYHLDERNLLERRDSPRYEMRVPLTFPAIH